MIVLVLLLALLVGGIGFIVTAARRLQGQPLSGQMFRRGFQYVLLYVLVLIVANGAVDLLGRVLGSSTVDDDGFVLAQSLTAIVIALPIAALLSWWIYRTHRRDPQEQESLLYQAYLTTAALTGAAMTAANLQQTLTTAIGSQDLNAQALVGVAIWAAVWAVHWRIIERSLTVPNTVAHVLLGCAIGLVLAAGGLIGLLATSLELLTGPEIIIGPYVGLGAAAGMFVSGAIIWSVYWFGAATKLPRNTAWHAYVLLLGVAGGLTTALFGAHGVVWHGLVHLVGYPELFTDWLDWSTAVATLVIGATVWWYHRTMLDPVPRSAVQRVYEYLTAGIGALAAAAGIGMLVLSLIDAIAPASLYYHPLNTLLGALPLFLIGASVWWLHWRRIQQHTRDDPDAELPAIPRRIYLVVLLGGSGVAVVIALISGVVDVVHDIVQGSLSLATLYKVRMEASFLAASAALIAYHIAVLRQDQRHGPITPPAAVRHGTLTLVGPADPSLDKDLAQHLEGPVRLLPVEVAVSWNIDAILAALATYDPDEDVVIIAHERGIEAHPAQALRYLK